MKRNILLKFAAVMTAMALTCTGSWAATSGGLSPARRVATQQATVTETVPAAVASSATSSLPSSYDLRNVSGQSFVTSVKTQNFGDCWSFAASSAIESNLLKKGYGTYDLSEIQMSYFAYDDPIVSLPGLKGDKTRLLVDEDYSQFGGDYFTAGMFVCKIKLLSSIFATSLYINRLINISELVSTLSTDFSKAFACNSHNSKPSLSIFFIINITPLFK